jgi:hypothetical protein
MVTAYHDSETKGETIMRSDGRRRGYLRRRTMIIAMALIAPVSALGIASSAQAAPKGIFSVFAQCPASTPGVTLCTFAQITSGEVKIGSTAVPINQTITLQGGGIPTGNPGEYFLFPAKNGESLSKTELNVPGGLTDLINCTEIKGEGFFEKFERETCKAIFENKVTGVTATTELVANEHDPALLNLANILETHGTGLTLPVRVHLNNPLLGSGCYIGSESNPISLHLTTGTTSPPAPNKPISGKLGEQFIEEENGNAIIGLKNNSLVDNSFSTPAAEGCGGFFSFILDAVLDAKLGLPSAAGHNTAIQTGTTRLTTAESVVESES